MTRFQRFRLEMLVRIRDFGLAIADVIPSSSPAGLRFQRVANAVAAFEAFLQRRELARSESRRISRALRVAVKEDMAAVVQTAKRLPQTGTDRLLFIRPLQQTSAVLVASARTFIELAKAREAAFIEFGLSPTFFADFAAHVDQLDAAVTTRNNGQSRRRETTSGLKHALADGLAAARDLDVMVPNVLRGDPVRLDYWRGARAIAGLPRSGRSRPAPQEPSQPEGAPHLQSVASAAAASQSEKSSHAESSSRPDDAIEQAQ